MSVYLEDDVLIIENMGDRDIEDLEYYINKVAPGRMRIYNWDNVTLDGDVVFKGNNIIRVFSSNFNFNGSHFHILEGSLVQFGHIVKRKNNKHRYYYPCNFKAPNIKTLGSPVGNAGRLHIYGGIFSAYCLWNFTGSVAGVELMNTKVEGYGKINGRNSSLLKTLFTKTSPKYGILTPTSTPKQYEDVDITGVIGTDDPVPAIVIDKDGGNIEWKYGVIENYNTLIKVLDSTYSGNINLLGCDVKGGYGVDSQSNNMNLYHKYRFSGTLCDRNGAVMIGSRIIIEEVKTKEVITLTTDGEGKFDTWLTYYRDLAGKPEGEYLGPYRITIDGASMVINVKDNIENIPLLAPDKDLGSPDNLKEITQLLEEVSNKVSNSDSDLKDLVGTVIIALGDKINTTVDKLEADSVDVYI